MIAALVPAAGSSVRMGRPKLLLEFQGQSLIGRLVSALRAGGAGSVVVVAPPADAAEGPAVAREARHSGAEVVVPLTRPAEMRDSIELGLETLAQGHCPRSVLLMPGDYPGITPEIVTQLVEYAVKMPERLVIPSYLGRRGHPIVLPWSIAVQVHSLPPGVGVNALVAQHAQRTTELALPYAEIVSDVDTPEDLNRWKASRDEFTVRVRLFALAKERAGRSEVEVELLPGSQIADLRSALGELLPALRPLLATVMFAVDEEYAGDEVPVGPGSRLAVIPPVSGGAEVRE